jgi:hypothetical protein
MVQGNALIGVYQAGFRAAADGRLYLRLPERQGCIKLPDVCVTDKNDTFHLQNVTFTSFRVMAKAVRRDMFNNALAADDVKPCVSGKFIVRARAFMEVATRLAPAAHDPDLPVDGTHGLPTPGVQQRGTPSTG